MSKECPKCKADMEEKFTLDDDACGSGCCRNVVYQCPECKNIELF